MNGKTKDENGKEKLQIIREAEINLIREAEINLIKRFLTFFLVVKGTKRDKIFLIFEG